MIGLNGATKRFGPTVAVDNISFQIGKGEVVGLLGPNGAGKTTTMRLLTGVYPPDEGSVTIAGLDAAENDLATRAKIGYLPENNPLYEDMFVSEYLGFVAELRGMGAEDANKALARTAKETGLKEVLSRPIGELSKGYRQRVGLAQAILHQPEILVLDEPTEGLDPNQRVDIRNLILAIGKRRTVLLSTHVLGEVQNTCSRILLINKGRLIADGPVEEIASGGTTRRKIVVEAKGTGIEKRLKALDGVDRVDRENAEGRRTRLTLSVSASDDIRPAIFDLAKEHDWQLWELHQESATLEEVFRDLTK
ncbi:MAG: ATP-binding cassette domain-containing protein [Actinobacteria bacterium]|nr:MAG: ATP-binding cassette domain-containing protein [Actinomycetota bacterium]